MKIIPCKQFFFGKRDFDSNAGYEVISHSQSLDTKEIDACLNSVMQIRPSTASIPSFRGAYAGFQITDNQFLLYKSNCSKEKEKGRNFFLVESFYIFDISIIINFHVNIWNLLFNLPDTSSFNHEVFLPNVIIDEQKDDDITEVCKLLYSKKKEIEKQSLVLHGLQSVIHGKKYIIVDPFNELDIREYFFLLSKMLTIKDMLLRKIYIGDEIQSDIDFDITLCKQYNHQLEVPQLNPQAILEEYSKEKNYSNWYVRIISKLLKENEVAYFQKLLSIVAEQKEYTIASSQLRTIISEKVLLDIIRIEKSADIIHTLDIKHIWRNSHKRLLQDDLLLLLTSILSKFDQYVWEMDDERILNTLVENFPIAIDNMLNLLLEKKQYATYINVLTNVISKISKNNNDYDETIIKQLRKSPLYGPDQEIYLLLLWVNGDTPREIIRKLGGLFSSRHPIILISSAVYWQLFNMIVNKLSVKNELFTSLSLITTQVKIENNKYLTITDRIINKEMITETDISGFVNLFIAGEVSLNEILITFLKLVFILKNGNYLISLGQYISNKHIQVKLHSKVWLDNFSLIYSDNWLEGVIPILASYLYIQSHFNQSHETMKYFSNLLIKKEYKIIEEIVKFQTMFFTVSKLDIGINVSLIENQDLDTQIVVISKYIILLGKYGLSKQERNFALKIYSSITSLNCLSDKEQYELMQVLMAINEVEMYLSIIELRIRGFLRNADNITAIKEINIVKAQKQRTGITNKNIFDEIELIKVKLTMHPISRNKIRRFLLELPANRISKEMFPELPMDFFADYIQSTRGRIVLYEFISKHKI